MTELEQVPQILFIKKDGCFLYFSHSETEVSQIRYDLKTKAMEKCKRGMWFPALRQYKFFKDLTLNDIRSSDEKFIQMLNITKSKNKNCRSLSTFISRLGDAMPYERFAAEGVQVDASPYRGGGWGRGRLIHWTLTEALYTKPIMSIFRDCGVVVDYRVNSDLNRIKDNLNPSKKKLWEDTILYLSTADFSPREKLDAFAYFRDYREFRDRYSELVLTHNYEYKALLKFCIKYLKTFENINLAEGAELLNDYYRMASEIGRGVNKYPKYLKSMHDIIAANYSSFKQSYDDIKFRDVQKPDLAFESTDYSIVVPEKPKDILEEGTNLGHCVSSYVNRIIEGQTLIVFCRRTKMKDVSLVTVEIVDNKIVQARGACNRALLYQEEEFLKRFAKEKKLESSWC